MAAQTRRVRWGILSTAKIAMTKVAPAIARAGNAEVLAVASRDAGRAREAADRLGVPSSHGSYEELLERPDVDAVYVPLPNDMHAEWTIKAAEAGKHVLCEKPLAMSAAQAEEMVRACARAGVLLQEAFMYKVHSTWLTVQRLLGEGRIGELQAIQSWFSYFNDDPGNIRNRRENGGGAMMDIGCYPISVSRFLTGAEPTEVLASVRRDPALGVDTLASAVLTFASGVQSTFTVSTRAERYQRVQVVGTEGRIEVEIPFNIPPSVPTRVLVTAGGDPPIAPAPAEMVFDPADQYTLQAEAFGEAVLSDGAVTVDSADAVANMRVVEAVLAF